MMPDNQNKFDKRAPQRGLRRHIGGIALPEPIDEDEAERMWLPNSGDPKEEPKENES